MASEITHKGRIIEITPEFTSVEIVSESACSACHAKALCGIGESKSKVIQLPTLAWENREIGQEVEVVLKATMGHKAVWLAYVIPLIVLVAVLLILLSFDMSELLAGLIAIASVGVHYLLLWLFRDKLKNEYIFKLKK